MTTWRRSGGVDDAAGRKTEQDIQAQKISTVTAMSARTRRTSENPASRPAPGISHASGTAYQSRSSWRDEITTNDAPAWQSNVPRSTKSRTQVDEDDRKTGIAFRAPSVAPSDSISKIQSRAPTKGRQYSTISTRASTRRPPLRSRYSSQDGTAVTDGVPLTETNVNALNQGGRSVRESTAYSRPKSRRPLRRHDSATSEGYGVDDRTATQQSTRASRRRATVTGDEYGYGGAGPSRSSFKSRATSARPTTAVASRSRATTVPKDSDGPGTKVSRRTSQAHGTTQAGSAAQNQQIATTGQKSRATSSSPSSARPSAPSAPADPFRPRSATSPTQASPPGFSEWERRVHVREYRRPSDGRWVSDRECIIRKMHSAQAPQGVEA
ncbi:uncharacterized protein LTR77_004694 [Saxophila tyrrhenica]|uniref:Uncharacterized protein n=1 Tax=Saxophila tyrrhenica TaxID=1690608 RepID=A0AAV9PAI2_9PEZI|nr:hypothetical protein LTR77_004694 [Saxophila tyrrhenica]